ncbi:MAG: hypothetical protein MZW92_12415 [Comamonadaceae bacterium]|nr:hypothetical protein [Comamonadaceae bacterium]
MTRMSRRVSRIKAIRIIREPRKNAALMTTYPTAAATVIQKYSVVATSIALKIIARMNDLEHVGNDEHETGDDIFDEAGFS